MNELGVVMRVGKRVAKLGDPILDLVNFEDFSFLSDPRFRQGGAINEFHGDGDGFLIFDKIVNPNNVGVGQSQAFAGFGLEVIER